jgi:hypothetical protein
MPPPFRHYFIILPFPLDTLMLIFRYAASLLMPPPLIR